MKEESISILNIPDSKLTPGMLQYKDAKAANPECVIMLRMGDFYEMFYEDAITAAKELEITLTARGQGEKRAPLAGIPYHSLENYLGKFVKRGYKVALVEQLEDPKKAKGLVKRGLVRIVTAGTLMEANLLSEKENNYLCALTTNANSASLAVCEISTGEFYTIFYLNLQSALSEIEKLGVKECLIAQSLEVDQELKEKLSAMNCIVSTLEDYYFKEDIARNTLLEHFKLQSLTSFDLENNVLNIRVCGALLHYILTTQKNALSHIKAIKKKSNQHIMLLDSSSYRNLELVKNIRDGSSRGTLLSVLDITITSLGSRLLKKWLKTPLLIKQAIEQRLDAVEELNNKIIMREELRDLLKSVYDLERLISRINYGNANPKDLLALKNSLEQIPLIKGQLSNTTSLLLAKIAAIENLQEIVALLDTAIREDAPLIIREGSMIKSEFNEELSNLNLIKNNAKAYLQTLETKERQKTGISTLKIGYTRVFGYYIEITKRHLDKVPVNYIRKQTTANSERYITVELKQEEEKILRAQERSVELEYDIFQDVLEEVAKKTASVQQAARAMAKLDVLCSLSTVSMQNNYARPRFVDENILHIREGRHAVVEKMQHNFIANDIVLNSAQMMIITGPNMAGKSTIMRSVALIVLLAQIGSFVPAKEVVLGIVDRIFTRVGAHDDLTSGQSTFMVEMNETAQILNNATNQSLIILDEIGRGTSTFDGVSIAWSVAEHIHNTIKAKTLFATHYHVMNKLSEKCGRIKNYNVAVREKEGEVVFLHKLIEGGTDQSYGVHVAKLAGLPNEVVLRAKEIQGILERDDEMLRKLKVKKVRDQLSLEKF